MITIKCDRCGKDVESKLFNPFVPFIPSYPCSDPNITERTFEPWETTRIYCEDKSSKIRIIDLCDDCKKSVYEYVFNFLQI